MYNNRKEAFTRAGAGQRAFTMAEILLSLTIIGVVAAITLPSLTGNINERTWNTQRKALYSRLSQAIALMPSLNGYGTYNATEDNAAETFVTSGLAKVLKINNICDSDKLQDCGIPSTFTTMSNSKTSFPITLRTWNTSFVPGFMNEISVNTKAAAFETQSGESILVYYNPKCIPNNSIMKVDVGELYQDVAPFMCANFIYDLNGKKGPNTVGKDIGIITAMYSTDSKVVAPMPLTTDVIEGGTSMVVNHQKALGACKTFNEESRLPNIDEYSAIWYNGILFNIPTLKVYWSSSMVDSTKAFYLGSGRGDRRERARNQNGYVRCILR